MKRKGVIAAMAGVILLAAGAVGAQAPSPAPATTAAPNTTGSFMDIAIPAWAAIGAVVIPLLAVVITNLFNNLRLRRQFEHERRSRIEDRAADLRKEIYLAAAEAIHAGITAAMNLANIAVSYDEAIQNYQAKAVAIAKIQVVADESVLRAITNVADDLTVAFANMARRRLPVENLQRQTTMIGDRITMHTDDSDRVLALMQEYDPAKDGGRDRFDALAARFEKANQIISSTWEEKAGLDRALFFAQMELLEEGMKELHRLLTLTVPAVSALRDELNLPIDDEILSSILHGSIEKQAGAMAEFTDSLRGLMEADEAEGE